MNLDCYIDHFSSDKIQIQLFIYLISLAYNIPITQVQCQSLTNRNLKTPQLGNAQMQTKAILCRYRPRRASMRELIFVSWSKQYSFVFIISANIVYMDIVWDLPQALVRTAWSDPDIRSSQTLWLVLRLA